MASTQLPTTEAASLRGHLGPVLNARFNSNGQYCLTSGQDKTIKLWNPSKGLLIKTYTGHGKEVNDVVASKDNSRLSSVSSDKLVLIWDVSTGKVIRRFRGHDGRVNCIQSGAEDTVLVTGSYDKTLRVWDCKSNSYEPIQVITGFKDSVLSIAVSEESIIGASVDGTIKEFDIRAGKMVTDAIHHPITGLALSNDKKCLLLACMDECVRLLDRDTGELLNEYKGHSHRSYKIGCCFSRCDGYVFCGDERNRVFCWDLVDPSRRVILEGHQGAVSSVAWQSKGDGLLSASYDGTARYWIAKKD